MRRRRNPRLYSADLDRLLSGGSPGPGQDGLAALLAAAKAPASAEELAGERAAVAAFVAAHRGAAPTGTPKRRSRVRIPSLARAATMKAAAGVAVLVIGGTAVAAQAGSLPRAAQDRAHSWFSGLGVPPPAPESPPSAPPSSGADPTTGPPARSPAAGPTTAPQASDNPVAPAADARGLCHSWQAAGDKKKGKPMATGPRRALLALAGDESKIAGFCAPYLAGPSAPAPEVTTGPSRPGGGNGPGTGNDPEPGKGADNGGPKGGGKGKPGGNDTADAAVDGRAGPHV
jgi:hypothetical protein